MACSDDVITAAKRIEMLLSKPNPTDWIQASRERSAARLRFIAKALEQINEGADYKSSEACSGRIVGITDTSSAD